MEILLVWTTLELKKKCFVKTECFSTNTQTLLCANVIHNGMAFGSEAYGR
jgi:hypothetical protein